MTNNLEAFTAAFAGENNLPFDAAVKYVSWLVAEGVLDFGVIDDTYTPVSGEFAQNVLAFPRVA